jgi:hypothetical protein
MDEFSSYRKSFENDVDGNLISSLEIWSIILLLFCVLRILLWLMKFIQNSILMIDITSFILPEIGSIPGLRHLEIFLENFTKNVKPLYVVTAEMKRQQRREKIKQSKRNQRAHQTE